MSDSHKLPILGTTPEVLSGVLQRVGMAKYLAKQVLGWVYEKKITDPQLMSNISKVNREKLSECLDFSLFQSVESLPSGDGLAIKYICKLQDGNTLETVVLKDKRYTSLCVSSQCGCPVNCDFCLTGKAGFKRNLKAHEIVAQVMLAEQEGHPISRIIFMGMGEPLLNYDEVFKAIDILTAEWSFNISKRKITVSTSGFLKCIERLITDERYINLAFSVGNAIPEKRVRIMPLEKHNPIVEVSQLLHRYLSLHNRKLTLEYTLLNGVNDGPEDIAALIQLAKYLNAKVNLINLNPHSRIPYEPISSEKLLQIRDRIRDAKCLVTIRFRKGQDISAACGQLGESLLSPST